MRHSVIKSFAKSVLPARTWTLLRLVRIEAGVWLFRNRCVEHSYGGFPMRVWLTDPMAQGWYDHEWPQLPEVDLLQSHRLKAGARVFDLGAHQGVVAMILARVVGPTGLVVAVEANEHNANVARRNRELNAMAQLEIVRAAIARQGGTLIFNRGLNGQVDDGSGEWGSVKVPAVTIDELSRQYGMPAVVFLDIEGFECAALDGAPHTRVSSADWFVEVHTRCGLEKLGGSVDELLSFFPPDRYDLYVRSEGNCSYRRLGEAPELLLERFFLVAMHRNS